MKKIGIGLIGCGAISPRHFEAIKQLPEFELKCVSDIDPEAAKKAGLEQNVDYYTDNDKLFNRKDISLVVVCTPIALHTKHATQAI
ncbi:MAG: Gfo/Idh/MocA family oxidoreductase, partial [Candidatus Diapherotrites archaeon]